MSEKYSLNKEDFKKILMTVVFSGGSAMVSTLIVLVGNMDFGSYAILIPVINIVLYSAKKFLEGKT